MIPLLSMEATKTFYRGRSNLGVVVNRFKQKESVYYCVFLPGVWGQVGN